MSTLFAGRCVFFFFSSSSLLTSLLRYLRLHTRNVTDLRLCSMFSVHGLRIFVCDLDIGVCMRVHVYVRRVFGYVNVFESTEFDGAQEIKIGLLQANLTGWLFVTILFLHNRKKALNLFLFALPSICDTAKIQKLFVIQSRTLDGVADSTDGSEFWVFSNSSIVCGNRMIPTNIYQFQIIIIDLFS